MKKLSKHTQVDILRLYAEGHSSYRVARLVGVGKTAVTKYVAKSGLSRSRKEASLIARHMDTAVKVEFFRSWSPNLAYLVGLVWADGHLGVKNRGKEVGLTMKEPELLRRIADEIGVRVRRCRNRDSWVCRITVGLREVVDWFESIGLARRKSFTVNWPVGLPQSLEPHFVRGVIDGDGSFCTDRRTGAEFFRFVSASEKFAEQIYEWMTRNIGVRGSLFCEKGKYWRIQLWVRDTERLRDYLAPSEEDWFLTRKWAC